ncbi:putative bifunctional diguanylate cyclase/phosphodiesterase [Deinococcus hopiensis]|nr:EAL domain-containing protein [Deinococcus hopiensis]
MGQRTNFTGAGRGRLLPLLFLIAAGHTLWVAASPPPGLTRKVFGNLFFLLPYLLAAALAFRAVRGQPQQRRAWGTIAAGLVCWAAGEVVFTVLDLLGRTTFPSVADLGFVLLPVLFLLGILQFFQPPASRLQRLTFVLDIALLIVTFAHLLWIDYVTVSWHTYAGQPLALLLATAYPATDILMIAVALAMALWSPREATRGHNPLLGLGILLFLWGSVGYGTLVTHSHYQVGGWLDLTWSWAAFLFGWAASDTLKPGRRPPLPPRVQAVLADTTALLLPLLPYVAVVVAFVVPLPQPLNGSAHAGSPHLQTAVVAVLALLRFVLTEIHNRRLTRRLDQQARYDALTGALSRSVVQTQLPALAREALVRGEQLAVMFIDLDRFKQINDSFGHTVGDQVLMQVAERLRRCVGPPDLLIRMGGDEFVLVLAQLSELRHAERTAQRVLQALAAPLDIMGERLSLSASLGVACLPDDTSDLEEALRFADLAMYQAKRAERNTWRFYNPQWQDQASERFQLERELKNAVEHGEFQVCYQPVQETRSGRFHGFEALLRWNSRRYGPVPPTRFIRMAEELGLIGPLGQWVLREALQQLKRWRAEGATTLTVAVNISAVQFRQKDFVVSVLAALQAEELPGDALILELTESSLLEDVPASRAVLTQLQAHGIAIALDDFGTGYSSLAYLRDLPVNILKIDRSFIWALDEIGAAIVHSIVSLAHELGLRVVAEGIETPQQLEQVRTLGCHDAQGFLLSRPLLPTEGTAFLRGQRQHGLKDNGEGSCRNTLHTS